MKKQKKRIAVIGCTGSVGSSVLDVCRSYPEKFCVTALAAETGRAALPALCREFLPHRVVLTRSRHDLPEGIELLTGEDALLRVVESDDTDHVVFASSGIAAVKALSLALRLGKEVSLANKESALILGDRLTPAVRRGILRPLDSEHNALWQCLAGEDGENVAQLILTASGGPFLRLPLDQLASVTAAQAAAHPVWSMGRKISVDSATMINKGIELLEAHYLFGLPPQRIVPLIHPGSKVHGLVTFIDGCTKMLLSQPDMRLASLTALSWPERLRLKLSGIAPVAMDPLDLHFERPRRERFPGLFTAMEAAQAGEPYPVILIGADEAAVQLFIEGKIAFTDIAKIVSEVLEGYSGGAADSVDDRAALYERCCRHTREYGMGGARKKVWN
ncbi:MAG: 1-deoxy-D-xylulose 5-phosphate reductoisomerase [Pyramidobacter sp.]|jgi:1-deoxy-D-xylulose-5-phosphate reductoisomerase